MTDRFPNPKLSIYKIDKLNRTINYNDKVKIPIKPFAGVIGVAPNTDELLSTIPPRKNGGNMDDPMYCRGFNYLFPSTS